MFRRVVSLALVGLFVWVTGCHSYTQVGVGELGEHRTVRVTLTSGEREILLDPVVVNDAISGREDKARRSNDPVVPLVIPLDQVETLEASHASAAKTVGLVAGIFVGVILIGSLIYAASDPCYFACD